MTTLHEGSGTLRKVRDVDLDVTTHVALEEPIDSGLVREVLVHSLIHPSTVGTRLKAMGYA